MFKLNLVTPEKKIETELEVDDLVVPAFRGQLNILPGHAPLVTTLSVGVMKYRSKETGDQKSVVISWGYCEVNPSGVYILAETAETVDEIDQDRAKAALKKAKERLGSNELPLDEVQKYQRKLNRAQARLELLD